jgi:hypothetical protein
LGYIPKDARWYIAGLVLEHTIEGDPRNVVHVNTHLIEADSPELAYQKANDLGSAAEREYANTDGMQVRVTFRGLRDLDVIHDDLEDGAELFYEEKTGIADEELRKWVKPKDELNVFAPRSDKSGGPNYLPEMVVKMMEAEG